MTDINIKLLNAIESMNARMDALEKKATTATTVASNEKPKFQSPDDEGETYKRYKKEAIEASNNLLSAFELITATYQKPDAMACDMAISGMKNARFDVHYARFYGGKATAEHKQRIARGRDSHDPSSFYEAKMASSITLFFAYREVAETLLKRLRNCAIDSAQFIDHGYQDDSRVTEREVNSLETKLDDVMLWGRAWRDYMSRQNKNQKDRLEKEVESAKAEGDTFGIHLI